MDRREHIKKRAVSALLTIAMMITMVMPSFYAAAASTYTVTFMANDTEFHTETVDSDTLVYLPSANPVSADGTAFVGWYDESDKPFNPEELISSDKTLTAKFSDELAIVTYIDADGSILDVLEGTIGEAAPATAKTPQTMLGKAFTHWALESDATGDEFTDALTESIILRPIFKDLAMAIFVTKGSTVAPQVDEEAFIPTIPTPPSKTGYVFSGWYEEETCVTPFDFSQEVTGIIYIYAKWLPDTGTPYTVNIMLEKADMHGAPRHPTAIGGTEDYELLGSISQAGTTEDMVTFADMNAITAIIPNPTTTNKAMRDTLYYCDFSYSETKSISGNGDTVINVYVTRHVFKMTFEVLPTDIIEYIDRNDTLHTLAPGQSLTVDVKLGHRTEWPSAVTINSSAQSFQTWGGFFGNRTERIPYADNYLAVMYSHNNYNATTGMISIGNSYYVPKKPIRDEITLKAKLIANPKFETRHYYVELSDTELAQYAAQGYIGMLSGVEVRSWTPTHSSAPTGYKNVTRYYKYDSKSAKNAQTNITASSVKGWPGKAIDGFETIGTTGSFVTSAFQVLEQIGATNEYNIYYYMPRKTYALTLEAFGGTIPAGYNAAQNVAFENSIASYIPPATDMVKAGYRFEGWFFDDVFTEEYDATNTAQNIMPGHAVTLYAKWVGTDVTVTYHVNGTEVENNSYSYGDLLLTHDLTNANLYNGNNVNTWNKGDFVDGLGIFEGWYYHVGSGVVLEFPLGIPLTENSYALEAKFKVTECKLEFYDADADVYNYETMPLKELSVWSNKNTVARSGNSLPRTPAHIGHTFMGWSLSNNISNITPDFYANTPIAESMKDPIDGTVKVYAVWKINDYTVTYYDGGHPEAGTMPAQETHEYRSGPVIFQGTDLTAPGYIFMGWHDSRDGKTYKAAEIPAFTNGMPAENVSFTAVWYKPGANTGAIAKLNKIDAEGSAPLSGAKFALYFIEKDGSTTKKGEYTTDKNGQISVKELRDGTYYWQEIVPPTGYQLDNKKHEFTLGISGEKAITIINGKTEVPNMLEGDNHFNYVVGYADGTVKPQNAILRSEVTAIFFRLLKEDVREQNIRETNSFSDVHSNDWYHTYVSTMAGLDIINGYSDGTFGANKYVTRAEFAAIAARFDAEDTAPASSFADTKGHWAENEIGIAVAKGWVKGMDDGLFHPNAYITRAEAMSLINRVLQRLPEDASDILDDAVQWKDNKNTESWYYIAVQEATNSHEYSRKENGYETWKKVRPNRDWTKEFES